MTGEARQDHALRPRLTGTFERRTWIVAALAAAALILSGLAAASASAETVWLCKPGLANNPCESSEETTVQLGNGSSFVENPKPASNPPIDCFYVYPTVSSQTSVNASLAIEPEETQIAIDQASRFSQACKVYAPIYPQLTITAINTPADITKESAEKAYIPALEAFQEYLSKYNDGRGFVLIGHSQGSLILEQLIKEQIDPSAALRKQLVSADLMGGNVLVPKGKTVGGTFKNISACQSAGQTGCVVAYSSFLKEPPAEAFFGRVSSPLLKETLTKEEIENDEVLCVNPALLIQGNTSGPLQRYDSTMPFPGLLGIRFKAVKGVTPWVSMPEQYSGQCERVNGASWLQVTDVGPAGDAREQITEPLGPDWGTHLEDVNVAVGNLVELTALQARVFLAGQPQVTSITPNAGSTLGGTAVTIKGSGFLAGATVTIGNTATSVNVVSEAEITADTSATAAGSDEVVVTDANGTSTGGPSYTYDTSPPPTLVTEQASTVTNSSAMLKGTVNPNGMEVSECKLEYGTTVSYGSTVPCAPAPGSGSSAVAVSAPVLGLSELTTYHFRISATNSGGTSSGPDQRFTTLSTPHWYKNNTRITEGERVGTISWGTLTLESSTASVTCKTASAANLENTANAAKQETVLFAAYECKAVGGGCAVAGGEARVGAQSLPWQGAARAEEGSGAFRQESLGVGLNVECFKGGVSVENLLFKAGLVGTETGTWTPKWQNGTTAAKPTEASFDEGSGHLYSEPGALPLTTKGALKLEGYEGRPLPLITLGKP